MEKKYWWLCQRVNNFVDCKTLSKTNAGVILNTHTYTDTDTDTNAHTHTHSEIMWTSAKVMYTNDAHWKRPWQLLRNHMLRVRNTMFVQLLLFRAYFAIIDIFSVMSTHYCIDKPYACFPLVSLTEYFMNYGLDQWMQYHLRILPIPRSAISTSWQSQCKYFTRRLSLSFSVPWFDNPALKHWRHWSRHINGTIWRYFSLHFCYSSITTP